MTMSMSCSLRSLTAALLSGVIVSSASAATIDWQTVVNNGDRMPGSTKNFSSYNQPSINPSCLVAIRARSKGPSQPTRGIYTRTMCTSGSSVRELVSVGDLVPHPNNIGGRFNEFPAFPRMDLSSGTIASRGQSTPVYRVTLPDGTETRVGTAGIYSTAGGTGQTVASQLGSIPWFRYFAVPGADPGTRFDQFPGSPAPFNKSLVAFKGNYTEDGTAKTGVFLRDSLASSGKSPVCLIANTGTRIPNQPSGGTATFGSTAPPTAGWSRVYFAGFDNEENPTLGGLYRVPGKCNPQLTTLVGIGDSVPGISGARFTRFGEAISLGGNYIGFWGSWGTQTRSITLQCPEDGNQDLINYCRSQHPNGFTTKVPTNQGIFIYNNSSSVPAAQRLKLIARTGTQFKDFLFWVFSGRPPGVGSGDETEEGEPARWRSSAFVAVSNNGPASNPPATAFKALAQTGMNGTYVRRTPTATIRPVLLTGAAGRSVDREAPADSKVVSVGIERDGFRACRLVLTASMLNEATSESWAGVYFSDDPCKP